MNQMITRVEKDLSKNENERGWIEKHLRSLDSQVEDLGRQIDNYREEIARSEKRIEDLEREIRESDQRLLEFNEQSESLIREIENLTAQRAAIEKAVYERAHKRPSRLRRAAR